MKMADYDVEVRARLECTACEGSFSRIMAHAYGKERHCWHHLSGFHFKNRGAGGA